MIHERTHLDLFSGIGGFALAARANGVRTVQFIEIDPRCRAFLAKAWLGVPIWDDIRTFSLANARRQRSGQDEPGRRPSERTIAGGLGQVWLLTAGVPCQPASRAGKQRGKEDDRWLWGEAVRVIAEVKPTWALLENPPGIGDVGLSGILSDLEAEGYEVRVLSIGACAVGAPHRRMRYWIICRRMADAGSEGYPERVVQPGISGQARLRNERQAADMGCKVRVGHAQESRGRAGFCDSQPRGERRDFAANPNCWANYVWLPCADGKVRRAPDDSFGLVDGLHRSVLGALGNSIVPQVAAQIIRAMIEAEE